MNGHNVGIKSGTKKVKCKVYRAEKSWGDGTDTGVHGTEIRAYHTALGEYKGEEDLGEFVSDGKMASGNTELESAYMHWHEVEKYEEKWCYDCGTHIHSDLCYYTGNHIHVLPEEEANYNELKEYEKNDPNWITISINKNQNMDEACLKPTECGNGSFSYKDGDKVETYDDWTGETDIDHWVVIWCKHCETRYQRKLIDGKEQWYKIDGNGDIIEPAELFEDGKIKCTGTRLVFECKQGKEWMAWDGTVNNWVSIKAEAENRPENNGEKDTKIYYERKPDGEKWLICGEDPEPPTSTPKIIGYTVGCGRNEGAIYWKKTCDKPLYETACDELATDIKEYKEQEPEQKTLQNPVLTDENGSYKFSGLDSMKKYYVKFVYNGMVYTNVLTTNAKIHNADNLSKANEIENNGETNHDYRTSFNDKFKEIRSYPENYKIVNKVFGEELGDYNKTYFQEDIVDIFKKISAKRVSDCQGEEDYKKACQLVAQELGNDIETKRKVQFVADCRIESKTVNKYPLVDKFVIDNVQIGNGDENTYWALYGSWEFRSNTGWTYTYRKEKGMYEYYNELTGEWRTVAEYEANMSNMGLWGDYTDNGNYKQGSPYNQLHINQGIKARPTFDMYILQDPLKAEVQINGKTETYNYDSRYSSGGLKFGISQDDYIGTNNNVGLRGAYMAKPLVNWENAINNIKEKRTREIETDEYTLEMRSEEVANGQSANYNASMTGKVDGNYQINDNYNLQPEDRLKIYVTYKIDVINQSTTIGAVKEIVDYYDPNYKFKEAYVGDEVGNKIGDVTASYTSIYGTNTQYTSKKGTYKTIYLRPNNETRLGDNSKQYIYVKLQLVGPNEDDETNVGALLSEKLLNNEEVKVMNLAEINGYKTYNDLDGNSTPGLIDIDSNPGNLNISDIEELKQENIINYPNIRSMYEDDTNRAPTIAIPIRKSRTVEGVVFEDTTGKDAKVYTNQTREGNGILDNGETRYTRSKSRISRNKK